MVGETSLARQLGLAEGAADEASPIAYPQTEEYSSVCG